MELPEADPALLDRIRVFDLNHVTPAAQALLRGQGIDVAALRAYYLPQSPGIKRELFEVRGDATRASRLAQAPSVLERLAALDFQDQILRDSCLTQLSPFGGMASTVHSVPFGVCTYYRFGGEQPFLLISGTFSSGGCRLALWIPGLAIAIGLSPGFVAQRLTPLLRGYQAHVQGLLPQYQRYLAHTKSHATAIVLDTPPFPHHLWNELPGLQRQLDSGAALRARQILVCSQPLGPLPELFPELADRVQHLPRGRLSREVFARRYLVVRPGSVLLPEAVVERVRRVAQARASADAHALVQRWQDDNLPVLGITLRTTNRRWLSQREGIVQLIRALQRRPLRFRVLLLGFSLVHEAQIDEHTAPILEAEQQLCRQIAAACPGALIDTLVGASIFDCFLVAGALDFYVANHGTIQHKVGWFTRCAGIVHANRLTLNSGTAFFATLVARQGGQVPTYIPAERVHDVAAEKSTGGRGNLGDYDFDWRVLLRPVVTALREASARRRGLSSPAPAPAP